MLCLLKISTIFTETSVEKGLSHISKIKIILETFFSHAIDISKWSFVGVLGCDVDHVRCCSDRKPFVIQSSAFYAR